MDRDSMSHLISLARYQIKCVIKFLFKPSDDIINFKIFLGSACKAMNDRAKKRGRRKYTNLNISRATRAFEMK